MSLLALAVMAQLSAVPLAEAPAVEAWASEDWPADALQALAKLPGVTLAVSTRSNMLRPEVFAALKRRKASALTVRAPLAEAHVDQLRKLAGTTLVLRLPEKPDAALMKSLTHLGPQLLRLQVGKLDEATANWLAGLKRLEVELDLRGRVPEQEELERLAQLARAGRVVRLLATDPPELVAAFKAVKLVRLVVESLDDRVPEPMVAALHEAGVPVRVRLDAKASVEDVRRLAALPRLSLELVLEGDSDQVLPRAQALLGGLTEEP